MAPLLLFYPRRFRRRLLLPPGWVALGFLLLLGCLLIRMQWRRLRPATIVQLTLPRYHPTVQQLAFYSLGSNSRAEYNPFADTGGAEATARLARMRPWHSFALLGQPAADSLQLAAVEATLKTIQADTTHAGGIRVWLGIGVAYWELIALLELVSRQQEHHYWLDIRRRPTTLYIITPQPIPPAQRLRVQDWVCQSPVSGERWNAGQLPTPQQRLYTLRLPERRPQLLLTLAIASLLLVSLAGTQVVACLLVA